MNNLQPDNTLSSSRLAMWRSLIALAYADGTLDANEKAMLADYIKTNHIEPHQHAILDADITNGVQLKDVYPGVTDLHDRAALLNIGNVLLHVDGQVNPVEQKIYDAIEHDQEMVVDFKKAIVAADTEADKEEEDWESQELKEKLDERIKEGPVERMIRYIADIQDLLTGNDPI